MKDKKPIEQEIQHLESRIRELRESLEDWDRHSVNTTGAKMYKEKARRVVFAGASNRVSYQRKCISELVGTDSI
jgi:hypothetical protein